jgi:hypothetical protein
VHKPYRDKKKLSVSLCVFVPLLEWLNVSKRRNSRERMGRSLGSSDLEVLKALIRRIRNCLSVGYRNWTEVRQFNLSVLVLRIRSQQIPPMDLYLRPETHARYFCKL